MASTAISAQGTKFYIAGSTTASKVISAITSTYPAQVTTSTSHGYVNGDKITISAVTTTTDVNTTFVVKNKTATTFAIDYNAIGLTPGLGGSPAVVGTDWTQVKNAITIKGLDGSAKEIDVTNLDSTAIEVLLGLQDNGNLSIDFDGDNADAGQLAIQAAKVDGAIRTFKFVLPAGSTPTCTFNGFVKKFDFMAGVNDKFKRAMDVRITGIITFA